MDLSPYNVRYCPAWVSSLGIFATTIRQRHFRRPSARIESANITIPELVLAYLFAFHLPESYSTLRTILTSSDSTKKQPKIQRALHQRLRRHQQNYPHHSSRSLPAHLRTISYIGRPCFKMSALSASAPPALDPDDSKLVLSPPLPPDPRLPLSPLAAPLHRTPKVKPDNHLIQERLEVPKINSSDVPPADPNWPQSRRVRPQRRLHRH